jgi:hypothetical protein
MGNSYLSMKILSHPVKIREQSNPGGASLNV